MIKKPLVTPAKLRRQILNRDNYECRICHNWNPDLNVHHKDWDRDNNHPHNLVTLCLVCHRQVHTENYRPSWYVDWPEPWGEDPEIE